MRSDFASKIQKMKPNIRKEYDKLFEIYTEESIVDFRGRITTFEMIFTEHFTEFHSAGTCLSLDEFNEQCGNEFEEKPKAFDEDYFINFAEYFYNLLTGIPSRFFGQYFYHMFDDSFVRQHILNVIEAIGYVSVCKDGFSIFVPKDNVVLEVAKSEYVPEDISYKVISYNHYSMQGDLEEKKATLVVLAGLIEPHEKVLSQTDNSFKSDLFYALNNLNIRHDNVDPADKRYYKKVVAEMDSDELEHWYDETYRMCLLAFMRLEQKDRKKEFDEVKSKIEVKE